MFEINDLNVHFGGIHAIKGISLRVEAGEIVTLIGANGAGKTTTLKAISRMVEATGDVHFCGEKILRISPHEIIRKGIALVPEGRGVFPRLSVLENLRMGAFVRDDKAAIADDIERMYAYFPRLKERADQLAGTLSGGEQQMLAIGRALMGRPRLLLLDEPSLGLAPLIVRQIFQIIREINTEQKMTVFLVEQNAFHALKLAHRAYVMVNGNISMSGTGAELLANPAVRAAYLEGGHGADAASAPQEVA